MGRKSREKKNRQATACAKFQPETLGYIEGLRLAAWMTDKSPEMIEMYRGENGIGRLPYHRVSFCTDLVGTMSPWAWPWPA